MLNATILECRQKVLDNYGDSIVIQFTISGHCSRRTLQYSISDALQKISRAIRNVLSGAVAIPNNHVDLNKALPKRQVLLCPMNVHSALPYLSQAKFKAQLEVIGATRPEISAGGLSGLSGCSD